MIQAKRDSLKTCRDIRKTSKDIRKTSRDIRKTSRDIRKTSRDTVQTGTAERPPLAERKKPSRRPVCFSERASPWGDGRGRFPTLSVFKWSGPRRTMLRATGKL
jgi:hypothetical protein